MPSLSICSYPSTEDKDGCTYWLSIDPWSARKGRQPHTVDYSARANSNIPSSGKDKTIVRATFLKHTNNNLESEIFAFNTVDINRWARNTAVKFNEMMAGHAPKIYFQEILRAQLESSKHCHRRENEYFVFSNKLPVGPCTIEFLFNSQHKPEVEEWKECLNAYVHHFFADMKGRMIVDTLHGTYNPRDGFTLGPPTVHSLAGRLGAEDKGENGVIRVMKAHRCNAYCSHLTSMGKLLYLGLYGDNVYSR